jgi:YegS/Rv2252/BmrU family lipid kinase
MSKKLLFILNAHSGKQQIKHHLLAIIDLFIKNGYEVTVYSTQGPSDAEKEVKAKASAYDLIVCAGGDGTLNETINGLMELDKRPYLGYIPTGTVNDFATSLNIPKEPYSAAMAIINGFVLPHDVGSFNERFFSYIAAFGAFTDVAYETPQQSKNLLGRQAYILKGVTKLHTLKSYHLAVEYDNKRIEDDFIFGMITNSTSVGGFKGLGGKDISLNDGLFEVSLIKKPKSFPELQAIIAFLLKQEPDPQYLHFFKTDKLYFKSNSNMTWTLDGEYGGSLADVFIKNNHAALQVLRNN